MTSARTALFAFEASRRIGLGHLNRCRVLMEECRARGLHCVVAARLAELEPRDHLPPDVPFHRIDSAMDPEAEVRFLAEAYRRHECAFAVVDHYHADETYQTALEEEGVRWLQFDSHARDPFLARWVLHASPAATPALYEPLRRRAHTQFLLGTDYAPVRAPFVAARQRAAVRSTLHRIVVCFGGGDDRGGARCVLAALRPLAGDVKVEVLASPLTVNLDALRAEVAAWPPATAALHVGVTQVEEFLLQADLCVTAGGVISYEAAILGAPMLLIPIADNQELNARGWADVGAGYYLGPLSALAPERILASVQQMRADPGALARMSETGLRAVDGRGAERIVSAVESGLERS